MHRMVEDLLVLARTGSGEKVARRAEDAAVLRSEAGRNAMARGVTRAIVEFLGQPQAARP